MKFKNINGYQYIFLDKNDKIYITTPNEPVDKIKITRDAKGLEISGDSSIISSIRGKGMQEKVYIPPFVKKDEIIKKCDNWLSLFKKTHDMFKKMVLEDEYRKQDIQMQLLFTKEDEGKDLKRCIKLTLEKNYITIKTGVSISINEENNDIYSYLVASVLDYFLSQNGKNQKLELRGNIYCVCEYEIDKKVTITAILSQLLCKYYDIVNSILINHNLGERSEQLITNLRNQISNQQIGNDLDYYINYSSIQCENVLKKTLNKK